MNKNYICLFVFLLNSILTILGQVGPSRQWSKTDDGISNSDERNALVVQAANGEFYTVGTSSSNQNLYILKYAANGGTPLSTINYKYATAGTNLQVKGAALDINNNLIVTLSLQKFNFNNPSALFFESKVLILKFNTGNGSNTLAWANDYFPSNAAANAIAAIPISITKSILNGNVLYTAGVVNSDSIWIARINTSTGNLTQKKVFKNFSQSVFGTNYNANYFSVSDFTIDQNLNIYIVGKTNYLASPIAGPGSTTDNTNGYILKTDSVFNPLFGGIGFVLNCKMITSSVAAATSTTSLDNAAYVVTDNSNNVYVAAELNDSSFNYFRLKVFKYNSSLVINPSWPIGGLSVDAGAASSNYRQTGKFFGMSILGSDIYVTYNKPNYYKTVAQINASNIAAAACMSKILGSTGALDKQYISTNYFSSTASDNFSIKDISAPLLGASSPNVYFFYNRKQTLSGSTTYNIRVAKLDPTFATPSVFGISTFNYAFTISGGGANLVEAYGGILDDTPSGTSTPIIVGRANYSSSRKYDGLMFKMNSSMTVAFDHYFNQSSDGSNFGRKIHMNGNDPITVGVLENTSTLADLYYSKCTSLNGNKVTTNVDNNNENQLFYDSDFDPISGNMYILQYSNTTLITTATQTVAKVDLALNSSQFANIKANTSYLMEAERIKYNKDATAGSNYVFVAGNGRGALIGMQKYTTGGIRIDSLPVVSTPGYSAANSSFLHDIVYDNNFAYALQSNRFNNKEQVGLAKISLGTVTLSAQSQPLYGAANMKNVNPYIVKLDPTNTNLYYVFKGLDTLTNQTKYKIASLVRSTVVARWQQEILPPSLGVSFSGGNVRLFFDKITQNPIVVTTTSNNLIFTEEYDKLSGNVISSDTYTIPGTSFNNITDIEFDSLSSNLYIASYGYAVPQLDFKGSIYSINTQSKLLNWVYKRPEANTIIFDISLSPLSNRLFITGRQQSTTNAFGTELFTDKLCTITQPVLSITGVKAFCSNSMVPINVTNYTSNLLWNTGSTSSSIVPNSALAASTPYFVKHTSPLDGCFKTSDSTYIIAKQPINKEICFTSFDKNQNKILVYFDAFASAGADSVIIYRDFGANNFQRVGAVTADSTWWQDNTLGTTITQALAYKIQIKDTCGQLGSLSYFHKPVFVTAFPNVVAGANTMNFEVYQRDAFPGGLPNKYFNLMGQNSSTGQWDSVATIAAPTAPTQTSFQIVFTPSSTQLTTYGSDYRIDAKLDTAAFKCTIDNFKAKGVFQAKSTKGGPSHSNLRTSSIGVIAVLANASILTYPNPSANGLFTISSSTNEQLDFEVINSVGKIVTKGQFVKSNVLNLQNESSGIYVLSISDGKTNIRQQIVK